MARKMKSASVQRPVNNTAKRANRKNPREDRNTNPNQFGDQEQGGFRLPRPKKKITLIPRNLTQESYIDALYDESINLVISTGEAGTGKSYVACCFAIEQLLAGKVDKIIVTRPMVQVSGEAPIGAVPGKISDKISPWAAPILDVFKEFFDVPTVEKLLVNEVIELIPLSIMRGRSLKRAVIIMDEMQNSTCESMLMALTRLGEGSKMIITGDRRQTDLRGKSGLADVIEKLNRIESSRIAMVHFTARDIERHPLIFDILRAYGHTD